MNLRITFFLVSMSFMGSLVSGCTQSQEPTTQNKTFTPSSPEEQAQTAGVLKNCRFQTPAPTYTFQAQIAANPIICDEGVARKVVVLTENPLPSGIHFSMESLSLEGIANEKIIGAPYKFYIENEAGYLILNLNITVK